MSSRAAKPSKRAVSFTTRDSSEGEGDGGSTSGRHGRWVADARGEEPERSVLDLAEGESGERVFHRGEDEAGWRALDGGAEGASGDREFDGIEGESGPGALDAPCERARGAVDAVDGAEVSRRAVASSASRAGASSAGDEGTRRDAGAQLAAVAAIPGAQHDPVSAFVRDVLEAYDDAALAQARFPGVDREVLREAERGVRDAQLELERCEAQLVAAKVARDAQLAALDVKAERALSYARVFASGDPALTERLAEVGRKRPAGSAERAPPRKRGRPRSQAVGEELFAVAGPAADGGKESVHGGGG